jgi:hypothetical protein
VTRQVARHYRYRQLHLRPRGLLARSAAYFKDVTTPIEELRRLSQEYAEGKYDTAPKNLLDPLRTNRAIPPKEEPWPKDSNPS